MPELPEVHTIVTQLQKLFLGQTIKTFNFAEKTLLRSSFCKDISNLKSFKVKFIKRIGKYIKIEFENKDETLIVHLGMAGIMRAGKNLPKNKHDIFRAEFENETNLILNDVRGFGQFHFLNKSEAERTLSKIAPDPLEEYWNPVRFVEKLRSKKLGIKKTLLDQKFISGIGNIYACEALFLAKIHPETPACKIDAASAVKLLSAITNVLQLGTAQGGASIRDYQQVDGVEGTFQNFINVYNRAKQPCPEALCSSTIQVFKISARSTYFCPECQQKETF